MAGLDSEGANNPIPWRAAAVLGVKHRHDKDFIPVLAGLRLNEALDLAVDPDLPTGSSMCIWVNWKGREVVLHRRQIFKLAAHPDRPAVVARGT